MNRFWMWLAWKAPKRLIYWASIRLMVYATTGKHSYQIVPELTAVDALRRWEGHFPIQPILMVDP